MSGYMIPEVWCNGGNGCAERELSETDCTLREYREYLRDCGWVRRRPVTDEERERNYQRGLSENALLDICPDCVEAGVS